MPSAASTSPTPTSHPTFDPAVLLDVPGLQPSDVAAVEAQLARVLGTQQDVVLVQAEAILALETVAKNLVGPGSTAINIATGPYGVIFGGWMRSTGATVVDVESGLDTVITVEQVRAALDAHPATSVLALAHAEAATGGSNPVTEIVALARERGVVTVVDAVASVGGEPVTPDAWGVDVCVIGPQKGLAGPAGVSALSISDRAWALVDANPAALRTSSLSLLDWREDWLRTDRTAIPGTPSVLETRALGAALARVEAEGLDAVLARHAAAAAAARDGLADVGLRLWQRGPDGYAGVATAVAVPDGVDGTEFTRRAIAEGGGIVGPGQGSLTGRLVRINHYGLLADVAAVERGLAGLGRVVAGLR